VTKLTLVNSSGNVFADLAVNAPDDKKDDARLAVDLAELSVMARKAGFADAAATILRGADRIAQLNGFLKPGQTLK
jgi:hypothetical protein